MTPELLMRTIQQKGFRTTLHLMEDKYGSCQYTKSKVLLLGILCYNILKIKADVIQLPYYYAVSGEAHSANYDDRFEDGEPCSKYYKKANRYGSGFCFLFVCPKHGHSYGFHLVNGAEGRKDPFSALLKYLPKAPRLLFYDFACQLSEYALNREPEYFSRTEFFHDIFHSVNHSCPYAFQCESIADKRCINTSAAEQFNSYFVLIKKTASCLKLSRFMLYAQHMIYLYNLDRTRTCLSRTEDLHRRVKPTK